METSQIILNNGLTFLAVATGIMLVVVGGFLIGYLYIILYLHIVKKYI